MEFCATSRRSLNRGCRFQRFLTLTLLLSFVTSSTTSSKTSWLTDSELSRFATRSTASPADGAEDFQIADSLVKMSSYFFAGTRDQYAEFPRWEQPSDATSGMTISFQFRTKQEEAFLLYTDDSNYSFLAISLRRRALLLRFKFGHQSKTAVLTLGSNMNDNRWHTVLVEKSFPSVRLTVDGNVTSQSVESAQDLAATTPTFVGAITKPYDVSNIALPYMYFMQRFTGWIRQISLNGKYVSPTRKYGVLEQSLDDTCDEFRNPCQNNGVCYKRGDETACDCSGTAFNGQYCEQSYDQAVATFTGSEWFKYKSTESISTYDDKITLFFKTTQPNGLMFHTGKSADFLSISLTGGIVQVALNLGGGAYRVNVEKPGTVFNDNKWHWVQVNRSFTKLRVLVDDIELQTNLDQEDFRELTLDNAIYVGGSPDTANLPGTQSFSTNFVGCLKEVTYVYDKPRENSSKREKVALTISRWAADEDSKVVVHGDVDFSCTATNLSLPVSFTRPDSFITIPSWSGKTKGSIEFNFRTREPNGLLMYGQGSASDLFAIEMYKGKIYLIIDLGSQTSRIPGKSSNRLYDGKWHQVKVTRMAKEVVFNVDGMRQFYMMEGTNTKLDLTSSMTVGGSDFGTGFNQLRGLWTSPKRQGFVGCVQNMVIDKDVVDLRSLAQSSGQNMIPSSLGSGDITAFCGGLGGRQCDSNPCENGAPCIEGMNRFICDCSRTSYKGSTCGEAVMSATFDGTQYMAFRMDRRVQTEGEDIFLRFRTPLSSGLLFATSSSRSKDKLTIELKNGRLKLTIDLDCTVPNCTAPRSGPETMESGFGLNDRSWHSVKLSRRGNRITFGVDGMHKGKVLAGRYTKLEFDSIFLGRMIDSNSTTTMPFAGALQNVVFNSIYLIDSCFSGEISCERNVSWDDSSVVVAKPVTFKGSDSYVAMYTLNGYEPMSLHMSIRTTVEDGLILYNGGSSGDFLAVELFGGKLTYIYNSGNGPKVMRIGDDKVNDNKWHDIRITRTVGNQHNLTVDKQTITQRGSGGKTNLDLSGNLYVGGVPDNMYRLYDLPDQVASRTGYQGCLGSFEINGVLQDMTYPNDKEIVGAVGTGCLKPSPECTPTTCNNGGKCIQQWDGIKCDCSLTSYVGRLCQHQGHSYLFGVDNGIILYNWRENYPSTRTDKLGLGFSTRQRDCVLLRVTGYTNPPEQDYLQLSIEGGKLILRFNVGGGRTVVLREDMPVADGVFHKVQIRRKWLNATMRVDQWPMRSVAPAGDARTRFALASPSIAPSARGTVATWLRGKERVASVFNSQSMILIGGLLSESALSTFLQPGSTGPVQIDRPFRGQMMGLFFNDVRVFDLAARNDDRVNFSGNVKRIGGPDISPTTPTISQPTTTMATLTIFATTKSTPIPNGSDPDDCDDEDMCPNSSGSGSGAIAALNEPSELVNALMATSTTTTFSTSSSAAHAQSGEKHALPDIQRVLLDMGFFTTQKPAPETSASTIVASSEQMTDYDVTADDETWDDARYLEEKSEVAYGSSDAGMGDAQDRDVALEGFDEVRKLFTNPGEDEEPTEAQESDSQTSDPDFDAVLDLFTMDDVVEYPLPSQEEPVESTTSTTSTASSVSNAVAVTTKQTTHVVAATPATSTKPYPVGRKSSSTISVDFAATFTQGTTHSPSTTFPTSTSADQHTTTTSLTSRLFAFVHPRIIPPEAKPTSVTADTARVTRPTTPTAQTVVDAHATSTTLTSTAFSEPASSTHSSNAHVLLFSPPATTPGEHTDLPPPPVPTTTAAADWTGKAESDLTTAPTGSLRFKPGAADSPPPPIPPMTPARSTTPSPPAFTANINVNDSSAASGPVSSVYVTSTDVAETKSSGAGGGGGPQSPPKKSPVQPPGANMINTSNTSSSPLDVTSNVASNVTATGPLGVGMAMTTAMIAGIAAVAACCVLLLFYVMYRFKKRDSVTYNVGERERQFGVMPKKGKPVPPVKNGSMKRDVKAQKHDKDKEYYV